MLAEAVESLEQAEVMVKRVVTATPIAIHHRINRFAAFSAKASADLVTIASSLMRQSLKPVEAELERPVPEIVRPNPRIEVQQLSRNQVSRELNLQSLVAVKDSEIHHHQLDQIGAKVGLQL